MKMAIRAINQNDRYPFSAPSVYQLLMVKKIADEDEYLREHLTWEWILEGKRRGVIE